MTGSEGGRRSDPDRSRFLATMSHDVRTPLTALRGALGLLERGDLPPEVMHQMVQMLRRASIRFERLTFGLLAIDLIDNGSMPILREVCDLRQMVEEAVASTRREHASVEFEPPDRAVDVACDRDRTLQALDHLLDNARKFGGPEGTVRVSVAAEDDSGVVRIIDEGPGVPEGDREKIFERYVQLAERLPNEPRGAGIGLYLARWNAAAMDGSVVAAEGGPGATFELRLPLMPDS